MEINQIIHTVVAGLDAMKGHNYLKRLEELTTTKIFSKALILEDLIKIDDKHGGSEEGLVSYLNGQMFDSATILSGEEKAYGLNEVFTGYTSSHDFMVLTNILISHVVG